MTWACASALLAVFIATMWQRELGLLPLIGGYKRSCLLWRDEAVALDLSVPRCVATMGPVAASPVFGSETQFCRWPSRIGNEER